MTLFIGNLKVARIITLSSVSLHAFPYIVQKNLVQFSSVSRSVVSDSLWPPWTAAHQASLSTTNSESLLKLMSIESVMPSNHLVLCRPVLLKNLCQHQVFSSESVLRIRWPKYWSLGFSISSSNEYSGRGSFKIDLGLISLLSKGLPRVFFHTTVQKASILWCSAFFIVQFSIYDCWKTHSFFTFTIG